MINTLSLTSFALIDLTTITFDRGFHILTGETGAGKTLLIQAIHLLSGHKVSTDLIRAGDETAIIEATFDIEHLPQVHKVLEEGGITFDKEELLIIRREVSRSSKNRIFINSQMTPLSLLATLGPHLLELVSQNSSQSIRQSDTQRKLLDLYGNLQKEAAVFERSYQEEQALTNKITLLKDENRKGRLERLKWEYEEWEVFGYQGGEEETLFEEYKKLANSEEATEKLSSMQRGLDHPSLIPTLAEFQKLANDPSLSEHLESAIVHLQEASFLTQKKLSETEHSPRRFEELEKRLSILNRLKKKYHLEPSEIPSHLEKIKTDIGLLENLDEKIATATEKLHLKKEENQTLALTLSNKRKTSAKNLEKRLQEELHTLNFPDAKTPIHFTIKPISSTGIDEITFYLAANKGEGAANLSHKSSGGEIARFLFALKIILAEKEDLPTLIFDEIDANIGGETAALVGQKLQFLGKKISGPCHYPFSPGGPLCRPPSPNF